MRELEEFFFKFFEGDSMFMEYKLSNAYHGEWLNAEQHNTMVHFGTLQSQPTGKIYGTQEIIPPGHTQPN